LSSPARASAGVMPGRPKWLASAAPSSTAIRKRQHPNQLPAIGIKATDHQFERGRNVFLGQRCTANMISDLIVLGLDLLDQQDEPRVGSDLHKSRSFWTS
jgi:hypothetical protein